MEINTARSRGRFKKSFLEHHSFMWKKTKWKPASHAEIKLMFLSSLLFNNNQWILNKKPQKISYSDFTLFSTESLWDASSLLSLSGKRIRVCWHMVSYSATWWFGLRLGLRASLTGQKTPQSHTHTLRTHNNQVDVIVRVSVIYLY